MKKLDSLQDLQEVSDKFEDVLEPFDPAYISDKPYEIPQISHYEKKFLRKVSILENKLRKAKIRYEWMERWRCFRVHKFIGNSEYPTYRYVRVNMDENDYSFGTEDEDLVYDGKVTVVVDAVAVWLDSKLIKKPTEYCVQPKKYHKGFCPVICETKEDAIEQHRFWASKTNFEWVIIEK